MFCGSGEAQSLMVEQRPLAAHQHHYHMMDLSNGGGGVAEHVQVPVSIPAYHVYSNGNSAAANCSASLAVLPAQDNNATNPQNPCSNPTNPQDPETPKAGERVLRYRECQRNHAVNIGGHAVDGCGEFMPGEDDAFKCAACGCHRNFHRRELEGEEYQPPCDRCFRKRRASSPVAPYCALPSPLPLSSGLAESDDPDANNNNNNINNHHHRGMKKRFRTKFSQEQKEKMYLFADKMGWRMQKQDEAIVQQFCNEIGVGKGVLKVWMHNNKNTLGKKP